MTNTMTASTANILIIGYGNTLRGDDGVGPRAAEAVAALALPGVRTLVCPQLSPEHAEPMARARMVIFVDAAVDAPRELQRRRLEPADTTQLMAHAADPRTLLALARDVFGRVPEAWLVTIPVETLEFSEALSPAAQRGLERAVQDIQKLCRLAN
jgi:hydrogenase maturation protease